MFYLEPFEGFNFLGKKAPDPFFTSFNLAAEFRERDEAKNEAENREYSIVLPG